MDTGQETRLRRRSPSTTTRPWPSSRRRAGRTGAAAAPVLQLQLSSALGPGRRRLVDDLSAPADLWLAAGIRFRLQTGGRAQQGHTQQGEGRSSTLRWQRCAAQTRSRAWNGSAAAISTARKVRISVRPQARATIGRWGPGPEAMGAGDGGRREAPAVDAHSRPSPAQRMVLRSRSETGLAAPSRASPSLATASGTFPSPFASTVAVSRHAPRAGWP